MNSGDAKKWELLERCERARDGKLSPDETADLEALLQKEPKMRELFARSLLIDAELRHDPRLVRDLPSEDTSTDNVLEFRRSSPVIPLALLATAACVMITVGIRTFVKEAPPSAITNAAPTVASITKSHGCRWGGSTLPTAEGSRISAGTFELVEGLATLKFDSGAEVVLEAPATLEIVDAMNCRLVRGTIVADVPKQAIGFTVDTKDAKVVDLGTRFGVSADEDGKYLVHVIEGLVEVGHKGEKGMKQVTPERSLDRGLLKKQLNPSLGEDDETNRWQPDVIVSDSEGWQTISTNYGNGRDAFIQSTKEPKNYGSEPFMRVKNTTFQEDLLRKGYVAFDLSKFDLEKIEDAEFSLNVEPSDLGFATLVPDSVFHVYGLTDEANDTWEEKGITWQNAPAMNGDEKLRHLPDPAKVVPLGTFELAQGTSRATCSIKGSALVDFLRSDTDGNATIIICRETDETAKNGFVHAFATRENRSNTPPLLRVKLRE
jgi:ferric-dicitrate binding protein FerR (iron transport regulator)